MCVCVCVWMLFSPLNPNSFCSQDCGRNKGSFFLTPSHDSQERREDEERIKATILMTSKACWGGRSLHQVGLARRCRVAKKTQLFILPFWCRGSLWCRPSELIWKHFAPWLSYCRWGVMSRRVNLRHIQLPHILQGFALLVISTFTTGWR